MATAPLKSMHSYAHFAWEDAASLAYLLHEQFEASRARLIFERVAAADLIRFEISVTSELAAFIGLTESQRPRVLNKLPDEVTKVCFLVLAIIGVLRAKAAIDLRDAYRDVLAPGRGNRITTSGVYAFATELQASITYEWPDEVFSSLDFSDLMTEAEMREEGVWRPLPPDVLPAMPRPEQPEPAAQREYTEVYATVGRSRVLKLKAGSDEFAWQLQIVCEARIGLVLLYPSQVEFDNPSLVSLFTRLLKFTMGPLPTRLNLPASMSEVADAVNVAHGSQVAVAAKRGGAPRACLKWPDEQLDLLSRELELVGERMPDAVELEAAYKAASYDLVVLGFRGMGSSGDYRAQRDCVEELVRTILAHRRRWIGGLKKEAPDRMRGEPTRDLAKAKRDLEKLASGNRTPYGEAIFLISQAMLAWRAGEWDADTALQVAGSAYVAYRYSLQDPYQRDPLTGELERVFGRGSTDMALLEAGVVQQVSGPFKVGGRWRQAKWLVLEAVTSDFDDPKWLPGAVQLSKAIEQALAFQADAHVNIDVDLRPMPMELSERGLPAPWSDSYSAAFQEVDELIRWIKRPEGHFRNTHLVPKTSNGPRMGLLVVAKGSSAEAVSKAFEAWPTACAAAVEERFLAADARRRQPLPEGLRIDAQPAPFLAPWQGTNERLALLSGQGWDADGRKAFRPA